MIYFYKKEGTARKQRKKISHFSVREGLILFLFYRQRDLGHALGREMWMISRCLHAGNKFYNLDWYSFIIFTNVINFEFDTFVSSPFNKPQTQITTNIWY